MNLISPAQTIVLTSGTGTARQKLNAFDAALQDAGICNFNLVKLSSVFPENCELLIGKEHIPNLPLGSIVFSVFTVIDVFPSWGGLGIAVPKNKKMQGVFFEGTNYESKSQCQENLLEMVTTGLKIRNLNQDDYDIYTEINPAYTKDEYFTVSVVAALYLK